MMGARRDPAAPAVVFVHGAVTRRTRTSFAQLLREYMFTNVLASKGLRRARSDYRASSGYGRDWRTAIYRHMGGKESGRCRGRREVSGREAEVNAKRIGVYGAATAASSR